MKSGILIFIIVMSLLVFFLIGLYLYILFFDVKFMKVDKNNINKISSFLPVKESYFENKTIKSLVYIYHFPEGYSIKFKYLNSNGKMEYNTITSAIGNVELEKYLKDNAKEIINLKILKGIIIIFSTIIILGIIKFFQL